MIKVKVKKNLISITGHANYDEYGKDIVCAAVSSVVITTIEGISKFDKNAITLNKTNDQMDIIINKFDIITNNLIDNMLNCLKEIQKQYKKNIQIINREE